MNEQTDINDDDLNNLMQKMTKILNNADSSLFLPCINKLYDNIIYIRLNNCVLENNQFKESSSESMNQFIHMVLLDNAFFLKSFWKCIFDMFIQECRYIVSIDDSISVICQYMIEEIISEKRKKAYEMQLEKNKFISSPSTRYQTNNSGQFPEKIYDAKKNILSDNDLMSRASYVMAKDVMAKAYPVCITIDGLCVCMLRNMRWSADKDSEFDKTMSNYMNTYAQQDENNRTQTFVSIVNTDCINSGGNIAIIHKFDRVEDIIIQAYKKIIENQNNEKSIHNVCRDIVEQNKAHNKENKI